MSLSDKLQELVIAKEDMKTALIGKGVTPTGGLSTYADAINRIESGGIVKLPPNTMFGGSRTITYIPNIDTSEYTTMYGMFSECYQLTNVPLFDTSNVTDMDYMFEECNSLQSVPLFNTSKVTSMEGMFQDCVNLQSVPKMSTSKVTNMWGMFYNCRKLQHIGGFKDLGKTLMETDVDWHTLNAFKMCYNITRESCLNIFNNLYDITNNPNGYTPPLLFEREVIARLSAEDIFIAVQKGWVISSY